MNSTIFEKYLRNGSLEEQSLTLLIFLVFSAIIYLISKKIVLRAIFHVIKKTKTQWDDKLIEHKVLQKLTYIIPLLFLYLTAPFFALYTPLIHKITLSFMIWFTLLAINSLLNAANDIYKSYPRSAHKPIKGYLQIITIFFYIIGIITIISIIIGKSPLILISGLGAMTAVLLLIFKDTILSFVASLQITFNDLVKIGDWLEVPQFNADGDVIDVALHTIKIQNWDKTITTIPTHKLIEGSFKNWRGMEETGGRRIKRSINIDLSTIKFCDANMMERFKKIEYIKDYLNKKEIEIEKFNKDHKIDTSVLINGRRLTNIGTFRAYLIQYLKHHPKISQNLTFLVRQLAPTERGLPIEIYVFSNDTAWANYEAIQADIFDHVLAIVPEFDLKIFQYPTGFDFKNRYIAD